MYLGRVTKIKQLTQATSDQYLTVEEAATFLQIKTPVLRNYLNQEKLTTYKFKTLTLLSKKEVESWVGRNRS